MTPRYSRSKHLAFFVCTLSFAIVILVTTGTSLRAQSLHQQRSNVVSEIEYLQSSLRDLESSKQWCLEGVREGSSECGDGTSVSSCTQCVRRNSSLINTFQNDLSAATQRLINIDQALSATPPRNVFESNPFPTGSRPNNPNPERIPSICSSSSGSRPFGLDCNLVK